jgi:hypothetical protein
MGTSQSSFMLSFRMARAMAPVISFSGMWFIPTCKPVIALISFISMKRMATMTTDQGATRTGNETKKT